MARKLSTESEHQLTGLMVARGVFTIIFGILALVWPGITLVSLAIITATWLFIGGIIGALSSIFMKDSYEHWFLRLILSLIQFGVGAYLVQRPGVSIATFMMLISLNFIIEGVVDLALSFTDESSDAGMRILGIVVGLLTIGGGILIWRYPVSGSLSFVWVLGLMALVSGTMSLWFGIDLRNRVSGGRD